MKTRPIVRSASIHAVPQRKKRRYVLGRQALVLGRKEELAIAEFVRVLSTDQKSATLLVMNGIKTLEAVAYVPFSELLAIHGLGESKLQDWRKQARTYLLARVNAVLQARAVRQSPDNDNDGEVTPVVSGGPPPPISGGSSAEAEDNDEE